MREKERERPPKAAPHTALGRGSGCAGLGGRFLWLMRRRLMRRKKRIFWGVFLHIASFHINSYTKRIFFVSRLRGMAKTITFAKEKRNRPIAFNSFETNQICDLALPATILSHAAKLVIPALAIIQKPILAM